MFATFLLSLCFFSTFCLVVCVCLCVLSCLSNDLEYDFIVWIYMGLLFENRVCRTNSNSLFACIHFHCIATTLDSNSCMPCCTQYQQHFAIHSQYYILISILYSSPHLCENTVISFKCTQMEAHYRSECKNLQTHQLHVIYW